jgi:hypothetical protein
MAPIIVGMVGAILVFMIAGGQSFEGARLTLAAAGVAVVAIAGLLILRFR